MKNNDNQRYYPIRDAEDPSKVTLTPISEEIYQAIYPEIERTRKRMQRAGRCVCPRSRLWACDGDCGICPYAAAGNHISMDTPLADHEDLTLADTLRDNSPLPESIAEDRALLAALYEELNALDPDGRLICELKANHTEREAADILGIPFTTFQYRWSKIRKQLAKKLQSFYY